MRLIPTILALSLGSVSSFACADWFEIELIIFDRQGENSRELWRHDAAEIDTSKALNIEMEHLMPSYPQCPMLDQEQIKALLAPDKLAQSTATGDTGTLTTEESIADVIKCVVVLPSDQHAPGTEQGHNRATEIDPEHFSSGSKSEYAVLTPIPPKPTQPVDIEQDIESSIQDNKPQLALPTTFSYQNVNYQVVEPSQRLTKIPLQINAAELPGELLIPHLLDSESLQLKELVKKIRWQKKLTPKLHLGWRQQVRARHLAKPLHLFAGQDYSDRYHRDGSQIVERTTLELGSPPLLQADSMPGVNSVSQYQAVATPEIPQILEPLWEIDGLFNVYLNHYLFIEVNINKKIPESVKMILDPELQISQEALDERGDSEQGQLVDTGISLTKSLAHQQAAKPDEARRKTVIADVPWLVNHTLSQHRRVKSKQIHYFDHPDLGIIVQIRRFKLPESTAVSQ